MEYGRIKRKQLSNKINLAIHKPTTTMINTTTLKEHLTQVILIVFSVVLGLYLSGKIEERNNRQESENLLTVIKSEVKDNIKLMEQFTSYHQEMDKNLDSLCKEEAFIAAFVQDKSILFNTLFTKGTFLHRLPSNDAWDIAKSHPLMVNIDYDKLLILSKIYSQQELTFEPMDAMFKKHSSKNVNLKKEAKSSLEFISDRLHEIVGREELLMRYYEQAEEILDLQVNREIKNE